ncbi:alpha/beta fold hydrolase [Erythrobacter arachoides]|uniref:Alpha/beta fold hydrolase n=1 Tax=Aurantiacibacter arachoides TaxID=1850444 RepID=A0A845A2I4_9SPHN|nr:alpha/beta fold hydrolase [Aurantiacibacter arachoides]MXO93167.1 alpha/beta fold hydrolase [Aurantiacibacter arachoides]GGD51505.1 hypothetical protein GCM10011411_09170 [Aurantiacibacter arachoides]
MPSQSVTFTGADGQELAGSLELSDGLPHGAALFAHCFTCGRQSLAAVNVTRALAAEGLATLRFDFTGLGGSEGEFGRDGFVGDVADLVAAARFLVERFGGPLLLVGHSLGGSAVLSAVDEIGEGAVAAVATIGAPADVPHVLERIEGDLAAIRRDGDGHVSIAGRPFAVTRKFVEDALRIDLVAEVARLRVPTMFLHSPLDQTVGVENAAELFAAAMHPKSFVSLDNADHLLLSARDAEFAAGMIAAWARHYLPMPQG